MHSSYISQINIYFSGICVRVIPISYYQFKISANISARAEN